MTPRTLGSDEATDRGSVNRMISWTWVMGSAYSSSPSEKTTSWRERVSSGMRTPSWKNCLHGVIDRAGGPLRRTWSPSARQAQGAREHVDAPRADLGDDLLDR